ncbi:hypothetical protein ACFL27_04640 [candidate division CSSED10-310 bacterium]|uniref:Uncharacterized protein n=1 Tax=candidate division CSSED10-310 bacterium TaxID=2855610 RepID=A0ABV6YTH0_UNCC1
MHQNKLCWNRSPVLNEIAKGKDLPANSFQNLLSLIDLPFLQEAYKQVSLSYNRNVTFHYEDKLHENLMDLEGRLQSGRYKTIPHSSPRSSKENGQNTVLNKAKFEDLLVQYIAANILAALYENVFYDSSYAYQFKKTKQQAANEFQHFVLKGPSVIKIDIQAEQARIDRSVLNLLEDKIQDQQFLNLLRSCLKEGDSGDNGNRNRVKFNDSPLFQILNNIFLHYVIDEWFENKIKPSMNGFCFMVRYDQEFTIGCADPRMTKQIIPLLQKRLGSFHVGIRQKSVSVISLSKPTVQKSLFQRGSRIIFMELLFSWQSKEGKWKLRQSPQWKLRPYLKQLWKQAKS